MIVILSLLLWISSEESIHPRVLVVGSRDNHVHDTVFDGIKASLKDTDVIRTTPGESKALVESADLIITMGTETREKLASKRAGKPLIATMVLEADPNPPTDTYSFPLAFKPDVQMKQIKRVLPDARVIGVIYNPDENQAFIDRAKETADTLGFQLRTFPITQPRQLQSALAAAEKQADLLWGIPDAMVLNKQTARPILRFCLQQKLPFFGVSEPWVRAGALFGLGRNYLEYGKRVGRFAGKLLEQKQDDAVEPARDPILFINKTTARLMKLNIPRETAKSAVLIR